MFPKKWRKRFICPLCHRKSVVYIDKYHDTETEIYRIAFCRSRNCNYRSSEYIDLVQYHLSLPELEDSFSKLANLISDQVVLIRPYFIKFIKIITLIVMLIALCVILPLKYLLLLIFSVILIGIVSVVVIIYVNLRYANHDSRSYDEDGYNRYGYNRYGYDRDGFLNDGRKRRRYDYDDD